MKDPDTDYRQAVALFRYGLIADLVHLPPGTKGLYRRIEEKAEIAYTIPGSTRTHVAPETIRHWLKCYRAGGFDALLPKPRADRGQSRTLPRNGGRAPAQRSRRANPALSVRLVIREALAGEELAPGLTLAPSTVHRLLSRHGLMRKDPEQPSERDRRRFAFARAGELWMSDVMHGPSVLVEGRSKRKTYLIAFLDDATRVIPYAAFALSENTATFLRCSSRRFCAAAFPHDSTSITAAITALTSWPWCAPSSASR